MIDPLQQSVVDMTQQDLEKERSIQAKALERMKAQAHLIPLCELFDTSRKSVIDEGSLGKHAPKYEYTHIN